MMAWHRWLRFSSVSALGVGVQLAVIATLASVGRVDYRAATLAGVAAAIVHNFLWHRRWTWGERGHGRRATGDRAAMTFARFVAANGAVSLGGNLVVMALLVGGAHVPLVPANAAAIVLCGLANFWLADRLVFGRRDRESR